MGIAFDDSSTKREHPIRGRFRGPLVGTSLICLKVLLQIRRISKPGNQKEKHCQIVRSSNLARGRQSTGPDNHLDTYDQQDAIKG